MISVTGLIESPFCLDTARALHCGQDYLSLNLSWITLLGTTLRLLGLFSILCFQLENLQHINKANSNLPNETTTLALGLGTMWRWSNLGTETPRLSLQTSRLRFWCQKHYDEPASPQSSTSSIVAEKDEELKTVWGNIYRSWVIYFLAARTSGWTTAMNSFFLSSSNSGDIVINSHSL